MGALPKNKVTRTEQGKRRHGNRPHLAKDAKVGRVPMARRGLVAAISRAVGLLGTSNAKALPATSEAVKSTDSKPGKGKSAKIQDRTPLSNVPTEAAAAASVTQARPARTTKAVTTAKRTDAHHAQHKG